MCPALSLKPCAELLILLSNCAPSGDTEIYVVLSGSESFRYDLHTRVQPWTLNLKNKTFRVHDD